MKVGNTRSQWPNPLGGSCRRWDRRLGRSRNKVAVPEGAAGSPPFSGARHRLPSGGGAEPRPHRDRCPSAGAGGACGVVLEGGTLTSSAAGCGRLPVRRSLGGVWNGVVDGGLVVGTLLGPEGTGPGVCPGGRCFCSGPPCFSYRRVPRGVRGFGGGVWGVSGWTLRTAQWTRASFDSLLVEEFL